MKEKMISSCKDCTNTCCKVGPGPYHSVRPEEYLEDFGEAAAYNTKCLALSNDNTCTLWGTPQFPHECRVYVCQNRSYTKEEIEDIDKVEEWECSECESAWMYVDNEPDGSNIYTCPSCGYVAKWSKEVIKEKDQR